MKVTWFVISINSNVFFNCVLSVLCWCGVEDATALNLLVQVRIDAVPSSMMERKPATCLTIVGWRHRGRLSWRPRYRSYGYLCRSKFTNSGHLTDVFIIRHVQETAGRTKSWWMGMIKLNDPVAVRCTSLRDFMRPLSRTSITQDGSMRIGDYDRPSQRWR